MILLVGIFDGILDYFYSFLKRNGHSCLFLDQSKIGSKIHFDSQYLYFNDQKIDSDSISGVYTRMASPNPQDKSTFQKDVIYTQLLMDYLSNNYKNIVNPFYAGVSNNSKPFQLSVLDLRYLKVPRTYVLANTYIEQLKFNKKDHYDYIYKSVSGSRSIVNKIEYINKKVTLPMVVQEFLGHENIRVHVLNNKVIATSIQSKNVDYRYDKAYNCTPVKLPKTIEDECINLNMQLDLSFSGIDLIKRYSDYYLLEVNPSPAYVMFEKSKCTYEISKELYKVLSS